MEFEIDHARGRLLAGLEKLSQCTAEMQRYAAAYEDRAMEEHDQVRQELSEYARSADARSCVPAAAFSISGVLAPWHRSRNAAASGV